MSFKRSSLRRSDLVSPSLSQFGMAGVLTLMAVVTGWLLDFGFGVAGAYLPVLGSVVTVTWTGGLWPSLFSQLLGVALTLGFRTHAFAVLSKADLYAAFVFLAVAKLTMFLLLNIRANRNLRQNRANLELIVQSTHNALWEWDLSTNYVWRSGKGVEGFNGNTKKAEHGLDSWLKRIHPSDEGEVWTSLRRAIDGGKSDWSHDYRLRRDDGSYAAVSDHGFIIRNKKGTALRMFGGIADVSGQRTAKEYLVHSTSRDTLTGLLNREALLSQFHRLLEKRRYRNEGLIAVLLIDIDYFASINERFGHDAGNQLLTAIAVRLTRCLREKDIAARSSDDEFVVLLECIEPSLDAIHIAKRVQQSLSAPFEISGRAIEVTASIGVSFAEAVPAEEAVRQADLAMHRAKAQGGARFCVFESVPDIKASYSPQYGDELQHSLHDGSLRLYYQPIVSLRDGQIVGMEALLRWQHPERGLMQPLDVLRLADEAGFSAQLGQWILRNCCLCLDRWRRSIHVPASLVMSLNLSIKELMRPTLLDEISEFLGNTGLGGSSLQIELTEATIMESDATSAKTLKRLRELGVCIALDNFGKGYSSLGRLQQFPISTIKIDGLFIKRPNVANSQMLEALMVWAEKLRLQVVMEEVENALQLRHLEGFRSVFAQGFLFSEAVSEEKAFQLLNSRHTWDIAALMNEINSCVSRETLKN